MRPEPQTWDLRKGRATSPVVLLLAVTGITFLTGCTSTHDLSPQSGSAASTRKTERQVAQSDEGNLSPQFRGAVASPPSTPKAFSPETREELKDVHVLEIVRRRRNEAYARILIDEGNTLRKQSKFQEALDKYHQAEKLLMTISAPTLWDPRSTMEGRE